MLDLGPEVREGVCAFPAREGAPYARLVSDVDATLNEMAGIRLPDVALALGFHSGWNPRHPDHGAPELPAIFVGFTVFPDEPPPVELFEKRAREVTEDLVEAGYVLAEDLELVVANSLRVHRAACQASRP